MYPNKTGLGIVLDIAELLGKSQVEVEPDSLNSH